MYYSDGCYFDIKNAELPILLIPTLVCNVIALVVMSQIKGLTESIDYLLVTVLASNDTISTLLYMGMWIGDWMSCGALRGSTACSVFGWLATLTVLWSAGIVLMMAACRYLAMVKPIYYRTKVSPKYVFFGLLGIFLFLMLMTMSSFAKLSMPYHYYKSNKVCAFNFAPGPGLSSHRLLLGVTSLIGVCTVLCVLYFNVSIIKKLRESKVAPSIPTRMTLAQVSFQNSRRTAFASVTVVVSIVYCITYAPFLVRILYDVFYGSAHQDDLRHSVTMSLLFMNPLLNPIIYVVFNKRYRMCLLRLVKSLFRCGTCTSYHHNSIDVLPVPQAFPHAIVPGHI